MKANNAYFPHIREHRETSENQGSRLSRAFTCPICGTPKTHHRLYGYKCSVNSEHDEQVANMTESEIAKAFERLEELK